MDSAVRSLLGQARAWTPKILSGSSQGRHVGPRLRLSAWEAKRLKTSPIVVLSPLRDEIEPAIAGLSAPEPLPLPAPAVAVRSTQGRIVLGWSGIGAQATEAAVRALVEDYHPRALLHVGIAGGLQPDARPGDVFVCEQVHHDGETLTCPLEPELQARLRSKLHLRLGSSVSVAEPVATPEAKRALAAAHPGADVVEMETFWAVQTAQELGLPILCLRVVCDPLEQRLPDLSGGLDPVGRPRPLALARCLLTRPRTLVALPGMARSFLRARQSLTRAVAAILADA